MKLTIIQRLQLNNFIGQQKGTISDIRSFSRIMDAIGLTAEEEKAIGLQALPGGLIRFEQTADEPKGFELKRQDEDLIKMTLQGGSFSPADLAWLEPILEQVS